MRISAHVFLAFVLFVPFSILGQVTFETFDEYSIGPAPQALKTGDFNNDGWPDIISANGTSGTTKHVSVALNNQSGGFNVTNLTALKGYYDLEVAFFDADTNLDFVASSLSLGMITVFLGNGNGTFNTTDITAGTGPLDVLTGDFNEDAKMDIAVLHQSSDDIYIYYGDGIGGFSVPQIIAVDAQSTYFTSGDFNSDNHLDFAVGANTTLHFYAGDGAGSFAGATSTSGFFGFDYLTSADLDSDGNMDIVGAGSSLGFTVSGAGNGTFSAPAFLSEGGLASFAADFDNDGNLDVVSTKKLKFIYYPGDGSGSYVEHRRMQVGGGKGMVAGDWNKDGNLDLASASAVSSLIGHLQITFGKGDGYFSSQFEYPTPNNPRGLTGEDFNEDGRVDLALVADGKLLIYLGEPNGTFTKISTQTAGSFLYDIETIHINSDNHIDLAVLDITANTVNLFTGDGTGLFTSAGSVNVTADFDLHVLDVNNDLIDDLILGGGQAQNVQIFKGNGNTTFSFLFEVDMGETVKSVFADFIDSDLNPDLAVLVIPVTGPAKVNFFQGDGLGGFTPPAGSELSLPEGGNTFTKGDFNNDGHLDFLSLASDGDIFIGKGDFTFTYSTTTTGVSLVEHSTVVKDIDGDGFGDLISGSDCSVCSTGGRIQINRGLGDGSFTAGFWAQTLVGGYRPIVGDFNNDGKNDIASLVNNGDFDGLSILLNTSGPPPCDVPNITVNPVATTLCSGGADYVLFVNATGTSPLTYQWQKDGVNIPSALTSPSFTLSNYTQADAGTYRCIVTNHCGNDTSTGAVIIINDSPGAPTTTNAGECGAASVTLIASGATNGNYRWYEVPTGGVALAGAVNGSFTTPLLSATKSYFVAITSGTCESSRTEVTALITNLIAIAVQPESKSVTIGDNVTLSTTVTGDNAVYQWKKDGVDLIGKNSAVLTIPNVGESDQGSYTCIVFNDCNSVATNQANLSVVVTGLERPNAISAKVYPNPSEGILIIKNSQEGNFKMVVHSLHGKEVYSQNLDSSDAIIDLSHLANGLYVVTLTNDNTTKQIRIMIDR